MFRAPRFWQNEGGLARALGPCSWMYQRISNWRNRRVIPHKVSVPVVCVGNVVMGGAGKTPTVLALTRMLQDAGLQPHILSRGYGGYYRDVIQVKPDLHNYTQVGDEPLLLARAAPTWIGANRIQAAKKAIREGANILIMDDGLQNPYLHKDLRIMVIDALQGMGNGRVFPAGPLREPIDIGLKKSDWVVTIGDENQEKQVLSSIIHDARLPHVRAHIEVDSVQHKSGIESKRVIAFSGIGFPEKFRRSLSQLNYDICHFVEFPDHHPYTILEIQHLVKMAQKQKAQLVTTEKDYLRVPIIYRSQVAVLPVYVQFDEAIKPLLSTWVSEHCPLLN